MKKNIDEIEAIELGIVIEEEGGKFYSAYAQKEENFETREVFLKLAHDEEEHIKILEKLHVEVCGNKLCTYEDKYMISDLLKEVKENGIFSQKGKVGQVIGKVGTSQEALQVGIEAEKQGVDFYAKLAKKVNTPSTAKVFNSLAEIEKGHLKILKERLANLEFAG